MAPRLSSSDQVKAVTGSCVQLFWGRSSADELMAHTLPALPNASHWPDFSPKAVSGSGRGVSLTIRLLSLS